MGCTSCKQSVRDEWIRVSSKESASKKVVLKKAVDKRLEDLLSRMKHNFVAEMQDATMMQKVMELSSYFFGRAAESEEFVQLLAYSLVSTHIRTTSKYGFRKQFVDALQQLTTTAHLSERSNGNLENLENDFLDCSAIFRRVRESKENMSTTKTNWADITQISTDTPGYLQEKSLVKDTPKEKDDREKAYSKCIDMMLSFLESYYNLLDHLPEQYFEEVGVNAEYLQTLRMRVGAAVVAAKVFNCEGTSGRRAAFIGAESIGKSTVINYLTSKGAGTMFMHVSKGMGTQHCCFISHGGMEKLQLGSGASYRSCNVEDRLRSISNQMNSGGNSSIAKFDVLRATKPFDPPGGVELIDVPGIKEEKQLETALALSVASTLVLCVGPCKTLRGQLGSGSLDLLPSIYESLEVKIPILCLVTRDVKRSDFDQEEHKYKADLKHFFPTCTCITVQWANFHSMEEQTEKNAAVSDFYRLINSTAHKARELNPFNTFLNLEHELTKFSNGLSKTLKRLLRGFLDDFKKTMTDNVATNLQEYGETENTPENMKEQLERIPIANTLDKDVLVTEAPVYQVLVNNQALVEVPDEAQIANELFIEIRMAGVKWLLTTGRRIHDDGFGKNFHSICKLCLPQSAGDTEENYCKHAYPFVCDKICDAAIQASRSAHTPDAEEEEEKDLQWWKKNCCTSLSYFFRSKSFPWIVTGFYLLRTEEANKLALFECFSGDKNFEVGKKFETWIKTVREELPRVPYRKWVKDCKQARNMEDRHTEVLKAMREACNQYVQIMKKSNLLSAKNGPLELLLDLCFVLVQRLLVFKPGTLKHGMEFTSFAKHLKDGAAGTVDLENQATAIAESKRDEIVGHCERALDLMQQHKAEKIKQWKETMSSMEKLLKEMTTIVSGLHTGFRSVHGDKPRVMLATNDYKTQEGFVRDAIKKVEGSTRFKTFVPPEIQGHTMANEVMNQLRSVGARTVVIVRRTDIFSADPEGWEVELLKGLATEPNVAQCFVLWQPRVDNWQTPEIQKRWTARAGHGVDISLVPVTADDEVRNFYNALDAAVGNADSDAKQRLIENEEKLKTMSHEFVGHVKEFQYARKRNSDESASFFQSNFTTNIRQSQEDFVSSLDGKLQTVDFRIPEVSFLQKQPDFISGGPDTDLKGNHLQTLNELQCRTFLFNTIMGQTMSMASELADIAYDKVMIKILDKVAEFFAMDSAVFLDELDAFCRTTPQNNEDMLRDFLCRENFKNMYVGCVLYSVVPILYCMLLPKILNQEKSPHEVTSKFFEEHCDQANRLLTAAKR